MAGNKDIIGGIATIVLSVSLPFVAASQAELGKSPALSRYEGLSKSFQDMRVANRGRIYDDLSDTDKDLFREYIQVKSFGEQLTADYARMNSAYKWDVGYAVGIPSVVIGGLIGAMLIHYGMNQKRRYNSDKSLQTA